MTADSNQGIMEKFVEFINTASEALADELVAPECIFHVPGRAEPLRGPAGYLAVIAMMREGFPDVQWTLEEMVSEGDKVAARFTMRGTHQGPFFAVPPTGRQVTVQALNLYEFSDGKIVRELGRPDMLGLLQQDRRVSAHVIHPGTEQDHQPRDIQTERGPHHRLSLGRSRVPTQGGRSWLPSCREA